MSIRLETTDFILPSSIVRPAPAYNNKQAQKKEKKKHFFFVIVQIFRFETIIKNYPYWVLSGFWVLSRVSFILFQSPL